VQKASTDDYSVREMLIEMRGDLALIRKDNETTSRIVVDLDTRLKRVEADGHYQRGAKHGFERGMRTIQALAGICGLGGIAAAIKVILPAIGGH
jgi:hypothetical protein